MQQAKLTAEAEGNKAKLMADAEGIRAKLEAEAEGKDKLADAQKKFEDAALTLEQLYAARDVLIAQADVLGKAYENANVNVISGGQGSLLGIPVGPEQGASIATMIESIENITGKSIKNILSSEDKQKEKEG